MTEAKELISVEVPNNYEPFAKQIAFHDSKVKFRALITGVGFGKSASGANELMKMALEYPKSVHLIIAPNGRIMDNATLSQFWKFCPESFVKIHLKAKSTIYLKNGARILYLTADNDRHVERLRGMEIGSFWADETRLFPSKIWEILLTRLRDKHGPLRGVVTTTPHGFDWLYWYFVKKAHPRTKQPLLNPNDYECFTGSTLDNPHTPEEWKQNLLAQLSGPFREQELFGKFVGFEGQVYETFSYELNVIKEIPELREYFAGIDFGFANPTACVIMGIDGDGRIYIIEEYYKSRQDIQDACIWLRERQLKYKDLHIYADPSGPMMINKLQEFGLNVSRANNDVMAGINFVHSQMTKQEDGKPRLFIHESCKSLLDEVNMYRYGEVKDDKHQREEPLKTDDHACDAMRYGIFTHMGTNRNFTLMNASAFF